MTIRLNTKKKLAKRSSGMYINDQTPATILQESIDENNTFEQRPIF
jgi:hypothetical protein